VALALQRRYEEAEAAFRAYMEREPSAATGPADLGLLRMEQQRYGEAIDFFRRALTLSPGSPGSPQNWPALQGRGEELRRDGKGIEADALLAEAAALRNDPRGLRARRISGLHDHREVASRRQPWAMAWALPGPRRGPSARGTRSRPATASETAA